MTILNRRIVLFLACASIFAMASRRTLASETDGQGDPLVVAGGSCGSSEPTDCADICNGQGDGSCCFAKCVCDTDPSATVRDKYCKEYVDKGCNKVSALKSPTPTPG